MRILQIIQKRQLRGAEIFACQLSLELVKKGHTVDFVYLFENNDLKIDFDLNFISLEAIRAKRFWDFSAYKKLNKIIIRGNYDLVQANAGDTLKYAALSKLIYGWKTVLIFRNANKMSSFIRSFFHKKLNQILVEQADHVISVSENCRKDFVKLFPKFNDSSSTGTIGTYQFDQIPDIIKDKNNSIWINVGSLVPEKNHEFLIEVFANSIHKNGNSELWLIGDGKLRPELEKKVKEYNIENKVKFLGYRKDVISLIKQAHVMVMPSKIEGLPGVILEALSCGTPVVAASVGGIPEVIQNGTNGYVIEGYNVQEYVDIIHNLLNNQNKTTAIVENGQSLIKENYLMSKIAVDFEKIYLHVLNE